MNQLEIEALRIAKNKTPLEHTTVPDYFVALLRNYIKVKKQISKKFPTSRKK